MPADVQSADSRCDSDDGGCLTLIVGRDEQAIPDGLAKVCDHAGNDAFSRRLLLNEMLVQSAMLLLRLFHCIRTVGWSSALQMWSPSWPSVCNTSVVGVQALQR